jgi:WD40-like Beta Propeller Repeat
MADLETGTYGRLRQGSGNASFVAPHWLLFLDCIEGPVFAQRLDVSGLRLTGDPVRIFDQPETPTGRAVYTAANNVFVGQRYSGLGTQRLVWCDRRGQELDAVPTPFDIWTAALSRDGHRLALGGFGMAVHEVDRGVATRIPDENAPGLHQVTMNPASSHDGTLLAYSTEAEGGNAIRLVRFSTGTSEEVFRAEPKTVSWPGWLPDGRSIVFVLRGDAALRSEVIALSLPDRKVQSLFASAARNLVLPRLSARGAHRLRLGRNRHSGDLRASPAGSWWRGTLVRGRRHLPTLAIGWEGALLRRSKRADRRGGRAARRRTRPVGAPCCGPNDPGLRATLGCDSKWRSFPAFRVGCVRRVHAHARLAVST